MHQVTGGFAVLKLFIIFSQIAEGNVIMKILIMCQKYLLCIAQIVQL